MMIRWISKAETKGIENSYEVFSDAIERVGEDFSWLAETLASLARDIQWDLKVIECISALSCANSYHLADILHDETLLSALRARLADAKDLWELITNPPAILMDERQKLFFYRGIPVALRPAYFGYLLLLLAKRPKEMITRQELYDRLWPGEMSYDGKNKPHERQISDHKRKIIAQIRKGIAGKNSIGTGELETLTFARPKVRYMLNLFREGVLILLHLATAHQGI